jgi:hypothetical protein
MKKTQHRRDIVCIHQLAKRAQALSILGLLVSSTSQAAPIAITGSGSYTQNFDLLPSSGSATWTDDLTLAGWYAQRTGTGVLIEADAGTTTGGNLYSYGAASMTERALGSLSTGATSAGNFAYGVQFLNSSTNPSTLNSLTYTGEQWRKSGVTVAQDLTLWYKISPTLVTSLNPELSNTGWTAIPAGDFNSPTNTASAGALDGNNLANRTAISINPNLIIPVGSYLMIRWKDMDQAGVDHGLAIDDLSLSWVASPTVTLSPGSVAIVGFNADGDQDLAMVALAPIPGNTVIYLTDNEWNGSAIGAGGAFVDSNEGVITWTAPLGGVAAGEVIQLKTLSTPTPTASVGTVARSGGFSLNTSNETVYLYQGAATIPTGFLGVIATHSADSVVGTGLAVSQIIHLPNDVDVAAYTGSRSNQSDFASYLTLLGNTASNWVTEDGTGDQHLNGTAPDVPFGTTAFSLTGSVNPFASWLAIHAPGQTASQDYDQDGMANGVEYFMGSAGNASTPHPAIVAGAISWPRAAAVTVASFKVEVSMDLVTWQDATVSHSTNLAITPTLVTFTMPSSHPKMFVRLVVVP